MTGHTGGLKPSHLQALERLGRRRVPAGELVDVLLAQRLAAISHQIRRQVGLLIDRQGHVQHLFVGEPSRIWLPDIGRQRVGSGHLRGLRHLHTVLGPAQLHADDCADLTRLRLDAVMALEVLPSGAGGALAWAHLLPAGPSETSTRTYLVPDLGRAQVNLPQVVAAIEAELGRQRPGRRPRGGPERALLVGVYPSREPASGRLRELEELAATAGVEVADRVVQVRRAADSHFVVGRGKLQEVMLRCVDLDASLLIFDQDLSPAQARAIASASDLRVIDRTQLILDIFAQHAHSRDGALQVELAQLKYNLPRLTDLDAGLSRLTGGIGGRGPGETKLEINRRRARDRIVRLERQIDRLGAQRALQRRRRTQTAQPTLSVVGYTNAGKSTLMGRLTGCEVKVADQLFATLDPTSRRLSLPFGREAILTDTVGFIRDLPPALVRAFHATLEELQSADLFVHVLDASDPEMPAHAAAVEAVLKSLQMALVPRVLVLNKVDRLPALTAQALARGWGAVPVSASTGAGLERLRAVLAEALSPASAARAARGWPPAGRRGALDVPA